MEKIKNLKGKLAVFLSIVLALSLVTLPNISMAEPSNDGILIDSTAKKLKDLKFSVWQEGSEITGADKLNPEKELEVRLEAEVPVKGDEGTTNFISKGDKATIKILEGIKLKDENERFSIKAPDGKAIATAFFKNLDDDIVVEISFDGDDSIFNGDVDTVGFELKMNFSLEKFKSFHATEGDKIKIFDKEYTWGKNQEPTPPSSVEIGLKKEGKVDKSDSTIQWTVTTLNDNFDLDGYSFYDDLTDVGEYKADSFTVDDVKIDDDKVLKNGKILEYKFKPGDKYNKIIVFKTKLRPEVFKGGREKSDISLTRNKAQLLDKVNKQVGEAQAEVQLSPQWIKKTLNTTNRTQDDINNGIYKWDIVINPEGYYLENVKVTDKVEEIYNSDVEYETLEFVEARLKRADGSEIKRYNSQPVNGIYDLENITEKLTLTITTKIKNFDKNKYSMIGNKATMKWKDSSSFYTGERRGIRPEFNGLGHPSKSGESTMHGAKWTVKVPNALVKELSKSGNVRVFDLMIFDPSVKDIPELQSGSKALQLPAELNGVRVNDILPINFNRQKLIDTSLNIKTEGLKYRIHQLKNKEGKYVADLLEIYADSSTSKDWEIDFEVEGYRESYLLKNATDNDESGQGEDFKLLNSAVLFVDNSKKDLVQAQAFYYGSRLDKDMLTAEGAEKFKKKPTAENANAYLPDKTKDKDKGFNHKTNSVIYRISINADGHQHLYDALGEIKVTDTLPEGWEFKKIDNTKDYIVFKGEKAVPNGYDPRVKAVGEPVDMSSVLEASGFIGEQKAEFKIKGNLPGPIVILLEAGPKSSELLNASQKNAREANSERKWWTTFKNKVMFEAINFTGKFVEAVQDIVFDGKVLDKKAEQIDNTKSIRWTVDYRPYAEFEEQDVIYLEDSLLTSGLEFRLDKNGKPKIDDDSFSLFEVELNEKGEIAKTTEIFDFELQYEAASKKISLKIPDKKKYYRFEYITDVKGSVDKAKNKVSIVGSSITFEPRETTFAVGSMTGSGYYKTKPKTPPTIPDKPKPPTPPSTPDKPKPPVTPPSEPPSKPETPPSEPPVTPPTTPETPPNEPPVAPPTTPRYPPSNPPDPNDPDSPEIIEVIGDDGVPLGKYKKVPNDDGGFEYIDEEGIPLGNMKLVSTGNDFPEMGLIAGAIMSLVGISLLIAGKQRRSNKDRK